MVRHDLKDLTRCYKPDPLSLLDVFMEAYMWVSPQLARIGFRFGIAKCHYWNYPTLYD